MVVNTRPLKRAKRPAADDLQDFLAFPAAAAVEGGGTSFRDAVQAFLTQYARLPPPPSAILAPGAAPAHLLTWRAAFRVGEAVVELGVVEEDVPRSRTVYCDQCRVVGWSGHPVCRKRYHFIIQNDGNSASSKQACKRCGTKLNLSETRCPSCNTEVTDDDLEDWAYLQLEDPTHLLHGVVHANGFGHLLRINGREGGSKYLTGSDIMSFWDRLCKMLYVRKVTVMDVSKKHGMEYRLLHSVTTGHAWYGEWAYEFGAGSFALTAEAHRKAVDTLSSVPLSFFFSHARSKRTQLQNTICMYLALSDRKLVTVRDLFCYLIQLLHESNEVSRSEVPGTNRPINSTSVVLCSWTEEDVERADKAMIKVLQAVGSLQWVSWRALRGAVCRAVESLELLDHCLKGLAGKSTDTGIIAVRCNAETGAIEYKIQPFSVPLPAQSSYRPPADHILCDIKFLYDALLNPATMHSYRPRAIQKSALNSAKKLLDCKQLIKHYDNATNTCGYPPNPFGLRIWCYAELVDQPKDFIVPPELLVLPSTATVADLKLEASKAYQGIYLIFHRFEAEHLLDCGEVDDSTNVKLLLGDNGTCRVRGRCHGDERRLGHFRMERGLESWTVDCTCGAKDDDGERMLACDTCGVWQHTRCVGIDDSDKVPARFVCGKCTARRRLANCIDSVERRGSCAWRCKDEIMPPIMEAGEYGRLTSVG